MNEDKATRYQRQRRHASAGGVLATGALLVALFVTGESAWLRDNVVALAGGAGPAAAALFTLVLAALAEVVSLPFVYFRGVTIERRYGLITQSVGHWWSDHLKASTLALVTTVGGGVAVSLLLARSPVWWWAIAAVLTIPVMVVLVYVTPALVVPMFSGARPLRRQELVDRLVALAGRANTQVIGVFEWHLGARTKKANAALTGVGRTRRILVSDTLLDEHSDDEIEVIMAHELAHHVYHDVWSTLSVQVVVAAAALYAGDVALDAASRLPGITGKDDLALFPLLAVVIGAARLVLAPVTNAISRAHERRADKYALEMTENVAAFLSAMRRLGTRNLSDDRPSPLVESLFHTHPSVGARISAAQAWASRRGAT